MSITRMATTLVTLGAATPGASTRGMAITITLVGATLGNALSHVAPIPLPLLASMGYVAVFAGAANTPFACTAMAMELFGTEVGVFAALACFASYAVSGHKGIYHSQKIHIPKSQYVSRTRDFIEFLFRRPPINSSGKDANL